MNYDIETHASFGQGSHVTVRLALGLLHHIQRVLKALDDRRQVRQLYAMNDHELKDIGISRADVDREAMKPIRLWH